MPAHQFTSGDPCGLTARIGLATPERQPAALFILLDIGTGDYWFWPRWQLYPPDLDWRGIIIGPGEGEQQLEVIPSFIWPDGAGVGGPFYFHGAILDANWTAVLGAMDSWEFRGTNR